jgi:hypothetical protein
MTGTEDDTFNALRRPSIQEMGDMYRRWIIPGTAISTSTEERRKFFHSNGWGVKEYINACRERNIDL